MKIASRVLSLVAVTSLGLLAVAGAAFTSVTSIQRDLKGLTDEATPLQIRTSETQERTERMLGLLLRQSVVTERAAVTQLGAAVEQELAQLERLQREITQIDATAGSDLSAFRGAQQEIARSVARHFDDAAAYLKESEAATAALAEAEQAVGVTRTAVTTIETDAGKAADRAQEANRTLATTMKNALFAMGRLRDFVILVNETDVVNNRFRLGPLKERLKTVADSLQRGEGVDGGDPTAKDLHAAVGRLVAAFMHESTGLFALRAAVLAKGAEGKGSDTEAGYAAQRKAILALVEEQSQKLGGAIDGAEVALVRQRQVLEASLKLRNEPGGVVAGSEGAALMIREMVGALRLLMLAATPEEALKARGKAVAMVERLKGDVAMMRGGLVQMRRADLVGNIDRASAALAKVAGSIAQVANAKDSLLQSEAAMRDALGRLKTVAERQAVAGAAQAHGIAQRQSDVTARVDRRVRQALLVIAALSAAVIAAGLAFGLTTVRHVTRRLDEAVRIAEAVADGDLRPVAAAPAAAGKGDETDRLIEALGAMVQTLTGMVARIHGASASINAGASEIAGGNQHLSQSTEEQVASLRETATSMDLLGGTVRSSLAAAREANTLAAAARDAAAQGGTVMGDVVTTMHEIQDSSRRIAEIISVIDGIAFQTNILALNAAVEAARAGVHGRGFAVVATEVRSLAQRCTQAAHEIKGIISTSVEKVDHGAALVERAGTGMQDMVGQVMRVSDLINSIAHASDGQNGALEQVNQSMRQLGQATQRNAALAEQGTAAAGNLCGDAQGLEEAIARFRIAAA